MKRTLLALFLLVVSLAGVTTALALDIPPKPTAWVTDNAGVLDASQQQALNEKLEAFARRSGSQILVMIYPTLGEEQLEDYTIRAAQQWKVKQDRAAILFIFVQERKIRFEIGYGLEGSINDAYAGRVIREIMAPRFQQNDYAGGINAALDNVTARIEKREEPIPLDAPQRGGGGAQGDGLALSPMTIALLFFIFFVVILPMMRRRSGCGCLPLFFPWGGSGITFGGGGGGFGGGGGGGWSVGGGWGGGGGGSFGGGGASGGW